MSKPTSTISSAVSIRVSNELLDAVREYAIAHNLINQSGRPDKRGEPNLSQAFSELVKIGLGQEVTVSDSVSRIDSAAAPNVDIESIVNNAIAPLLTRIEALENTRSEATAPANFTQAL